MSDNIISTTSENLIANLIDSLQSKQVNTALNQGVNLNNSQKKLNNLPSLVDSDTLNEIKNGEYGITLKDYTTLSTYQNTMSTLYGNSSANGFSNYLNKLYGNSDKNSSKINAKTFLEKMREVGVSNKSALKMYSAIQKYSVTDTINNNFISAKI